MSYLFVFALYTLVDMSVRRVSVITDSELFNPASMPHALTRAAEMAAAAAAFGRQPAGRRRASMANIRASSAEVCILFSLSYVYV